MGAYSDYPAVKKLSALGIAGAFESIISAEDPEVRGFKPHTNGFEVSAKKMGLLPEQILYVGDRVDVDGAGALQAGMGAAILSGRPIKSNPRALRISSLNDLMHL